MMFKQYLQVTKPGASSWQHHLVIATVFCCLKKAALIIPCLCTLGLRLSLVVASGLCI